MPTVMAKSCTVRSFFLTIGENPDIIASPSQQGTKDTMNSEIEVFREFIRKKGLRNTPEREQVVQAVFSIHDHFDVEELYSLLLRRSEKISKATVYRTIPLLLESGLIQEAFFQDGHIHYEHIYGHDHHCHLRCVNCGKVVEFTEQAVREVEQKLEANYDFLVTGHRLEVYGYCGKCKAHLGSVDTDKL